MTRFVVVSSFRQLGSDKIYFFSHTNYKRAAAKFFKGYEYVMCSESFSVDRSSLVKIHSNIYMLRDVYEN